MSKSLIAQASDHGKGIATASGAALTLLMAFVALGPAQRTEVLLGLCALGGAMFGALVLGAQFLISKHLEQLHRAAGAADLHPQLQAKDDALKATNEIIKAIEAEKAELSLALEREKNAYAAEAQRLRDEVTTLADRLEFSEQEHSDLGNEFERLKVESASCFRMETVSGEKVAASSIEARGHVRDLRAAGPLSAYQAKVRSKKFFEYIVGMLFYRLQGPIGMEYAGVWKSVQGKAMTPIFDRGTRDAGSIEVLRATILEHLKRLPPGQTRLFVVQEQGIDSSGRGIGTLCLVVGEKSRHVLVLVATQREELHSCKTVLELFGHDIEDFLTVLGENQISDSGSARADA